MRLGIKWLSALALLCGCDSSDPEPISFTGVAMTIPYRLLVGDAQVAEQQDLVERELQAVFDEVNTVYNDWNPQSEISKLNQAGAGERRHLSIELTRLLEITEKLVMLTEGRFDPTVSPLQKLWRRHLEEGQLPSDRELAALEGCVGWDKLQHEHRSFWKQHRATRVDLGGIAKGYCVDRVIQRLKAAGFQELYFEWGGEIATAGQHPSGRPWRIFISSLGSNDPAQAIATLELQNQALATSGDYMQAWTVGDKTYFHIVNPQTGRPLELRNDTIASVSVLAPNCTVADGLATALMTFGSAGEARLWAAELKRDYPELSFWIVTRAEEKNIHHREQ